MHVVGGQDSGKLVCGWGKAAEGRQLAPHRGKTVVVEGRSRAIGGGAAANAALVEHIVVEAGVKPC